MRLFAAVLFSPRFTEAVTEVQSQLRAVCRRGNFTRLENLHLTLAFIGETDDLAGACRALETLPPRPTFEISLRGAGRFDELHWVGLKESAPLAALADDVRCALRAAGFAIERRAFSPHITLVRQAELRSQPRLCVPPASMTVTHISLMSSLRENGRLVYDEVFTRNITL
ncbi:MAG: RNA 2',3'-cyclic phosphodiesterase [Clostridia bacterium]|nr:RNA 2',3'-cyclic phosphodiesterase [Clostridia bacterium]